MLAQHDINTLECDEDSSREETADALQRAINSLTAWRLQGSYGRSMMAAIEAGECCLGKDATTDYWGNRIPSRFEVKIGTKGSVDFVRQRMGADWAKRIEGI